MAKPNYSFEKRQRELAKKKKKEEKEKEKAGRKVGDAQAEQPGAEGAENEGQAATEPPSMGPTGG